MPCQGSRVIGSTIPIIVIHLGQVLDEARFWLRVTPPPILISSAIGVIVLAIDVILVNLSIAIVVSVIDRPIVDIVVGSV